MSTAHTPAASAYTRLPGRATGERNPTASLSSSALVSGFEIRYASLFREGRGLVFPCDAQGMVALDELSDRARGNYLFARAMVGREFATPRVVPSSAEPAGAH